MLVTGRSSNLTWPSPRFGNEADFSLPDKFIPLFIALGQQTIELPLPNKPSIVVYKTQEGTYMVSAREVSVEYSAAFKPINAWRKEDRYDMSKMPDRQEVDRPVQEALTARKNKQAAYEEMAQILTDAEVPAIAG